MHVCLAANHLATTIGSHAKVTWCWASNSEYRLLKLKQCHWVTFFFYIYTPLSTQHFCGVGCRCSPFQKLREGVSHIQSGYYVLPPRCFQILGTTTAVTGESLLSCNWLQDGNSSRGTWASFLLLLGCSKGFRKEQLWSSFCWQSALLLFFGRAVSQIRLPKLFCLRTAD